jgi:hypothetical protein
MLVLLLSTCCWPASLHPHLVVHLSCREAFGRQDHTGTDYVEAALNRSCSLQQVPSSISQDLPDLQQEFQHATSQQQQLGSSQQRLQQLDLQQQQQRQQQGMAMSMSPSLPPGFDPHGFMPPGFQIGMGNGMPGMRASGGFGGKEQQLQPDMSSELLLGKGQGGCCGLICCVNMRCRHQQVVRQWYQYSWVPNVQCMLAHGVAFFVVNILGVFVSP